MQYKISFVDHAWVVNADSTGKVTKTIFYYSSLDPIVFDYPIFVFQ